jgi:septal ring factor EnvC (AmiA/AmiB activator)
MSNPIPEAEKKAEEFVFRTFEAGWKMVTLRGLLIVAGILLIFGLLRGCRMEQSATQYQQQMQVWQKKAASVMAENQTVTKEVDSLQKVSKSQGTRADSLTWVIKDYKLTQLNERRKNDSMFAVLEHLSPLDSNPALQLALNYRTEADSLVIALSKADVRDSLRVSQISNLSTSISLLRVANDSLSLIISTTPIYHPPKLLGVIPYPSRTQALLGGIVIGIITTITGVVHR